MEDKKLIYDEVILPNDSELYRKDRWKSIPEIVHNDQQVKGFFGDYRWLSNFGNAVVFLDEISYPSVEVAYQASKRDINVRDYFHRCTSRQSIAFNRKYIPTYYLPGIWENIKVDIMRSLLVQKFNPKLNPENNIKLIETGEKYLEETNWWDDIFWGKDLQGLGINKLGELIMEIRSTL